MDLQKRIEELRNKVEGYNSKIEELNKDVEAYKSENDNYRSKVTELENSLKDYQTRIDTISSEKSKIMETFEEDRIRRRFDSALSGYKFKNEFEKKGIENIVFSKKDGKYMPDDELDSVITKFLTANKDADKPSEEENKEVVDTNVKEVDESVNVKSRMLELLSKQKRTREELQELLQLEKQLEL